MKKKRIIVRRRKQPLTLTQRRYLDIKKFMA